MAASLAEENSCWKLKVSDETLPSSINAKSASMIAGYSSVKLGFSSSSVLKSYHSVVIFFLIHHSKLPS